MTTSSLQPIGSNGYPVCPESLDGADDGILAVLPDDRIVLLIGHTKFRVGSGHGCGNSCGHTEWEWESERTGQKGLYNLIRGLPAAINSKSLTMPLKAKNTWNNKVATLGFQLLDDPLLAEEAISEGIDEFLNQFTTKHKKAHKP